MWTARILAAATACLCVALMACSSPHQDAQGQARPASQAPPRRYDLTGKVVSVDRAGKKVTVDNEPIPGFMGAMTMAYPVKDEHLLDGLSPGDRVTAKFIVNGGEFWLENIVDAPASRLP